MCVTQRRIDFLREVFVSKSAVSRVCTAGATDTAVPLLSRKTARTALQRPLTDLTSTTDSNLTALPDGFDWQSYLVYHPDLKDAGILSRPQAEEHYRQFGVKQKLLYKRIHVVMRYTACTGAHHLLMNLHQNDIYCTCSPVSLSHSMFVA